ncbi:MAG: CRISPR-associated protein Cas4 [Syntrophales bacterium]|nr:CRISPR-associated protein Cas4 [Syntrophales bacterium]
MYKEDELLPLSSLQHMVFCPRQCALMFIEQVWDENRLTVEGRIFHERVHELGQETRGDVRISRGVFIRSLRLGIVGIADVIEFHHQTDSDIWHPFPVEYKRGKPKADDCDKVQLCAQAICLEEMLGVTIPAGALFYGQTRHRFDVAFDENLRLEAEETAIRAHDLIASGQTPPPVYEKRCESCSLISECLPKTIQKRRSVKTYLMRMLAEP